VTNKKWSDSKSKPSNKRLNYLIKDEIKATKEYKKYGYNTLSKQENQHKKFLQSELKRRKKGG
jgi:hypothetical protein